MDRARKKLASAIDGIRNFHTKIELDVEEKIAPEHCCLSKVSFTLNLILPFFSLFFLGLAYKSVTRVSNKYNNNNRAKEYLLHAYIFYL